LSTQPDPAALPAVTDLLDRVRAGYNREALATSSVASLGIASSKGDELMLALIAAILIALYAFGVDLDDINLFYLGLAFWAAHFAFGIPWPRRWR